MCSLPLKKCTCTTRHARVASGDTVPVYVVLCSSPLLLLIFFLQFARPRWGCLSAVACSIGIVRRIPFFYFCASVSIFSSLAIPLLQMVILCTSVSPTGT